MQGSKKEYVSEHSKEYSAVKVIQTGTDTGLKSGRRNEVAQNKKILTTAITDD